MNKPGNDQKNNLPDSIDPRIRPLAHTLARSLLPPGQWDFAGGGQTRPRVISAHGSACPDVSFSHSRGWVAAALAENGRVGIDLEIPHRQRNYAAMAEAYFSPEEIQAVAKDGEEAFLAFWTLREAVAKLGDDGLAAALALEGGLILGGRNGLCGNGVWVASHRKLGDAHLALAWAPTPWITESGRLLASAMGSIASVCTHTWNSI